MVCSLFCPFSFPKVLMCDDFIFFYRVQPLLLDVNVSYSVPPPSFLPRWGEECRDLGPWRERFNSIWDVHTCQSFVIIFFPFQINLTSGTSNEQKSSGKSFPWWCLARVAITKCGKGLVDYTTRYPERSQVLHQPMGLSPVRIACAASSP